MSWSSEVTADSPLAWWRQDDTSGTTMTDSSGNGRNGTWTTSPAFSQTSLIATDSNFACDYSSDNAEVADGAWMDVSTITVEAWYKPDSAAADEVLISRYAGTSTNRAFFLQRRTTGVVRFAWYDTGGTQRLCDGATALVAGTAYHIVATVDSSGVGTVYINGVQDGTLDPAGSLTMRLTSTSAIRVGGYNGGSTLDTNGILDEVAIYGTALSAARILAHYDAAVGTAGADLSVAATMPLPTLAVDLSAEFAADLSVAATMPLPTLAVALDAPLVDVDLSVAATMPLPTLAVDLNVAPLITQLTVAGTMPLPTLAVDLTGFNDSDLSVAATMPLPVLAVDLDVTALTDTIAVGGTMPLPALAVSLTANVVTATDVNNNAYAIMFTGDADVVWEPAVVARPVLLANGEAQISARKIDDVTLGNTGMATLDETVVSIPRHRDRILIGGVDWTWQDDVPIELPDYELLEPFMYGDGGTLVLPQVNARYERLGAGYGGRLKRVRLGAKVVYQRVDDDPDSPTYDEVVATDYKGFILREGRRGDQLALAIGGELLGRAALKWHPVPIFRKVRDAGIQLFNSVIGMGLRYTPRLQTIGINLVSRGGMQEDEYLLDTLAQLTTGDGDQWTVMPTASGAYTASLKDRTTVNATVYLDNEFATEDLGNDLAEKSNRIWINALAPDGQRIMHASAPNLQATETPELPLVGGFPMTIGDLDEDTSTGDGVTVLVWRLTFTGLLDKDDLPGGFDADVRDAVVDFQKSAGCANLAGSVDSETWDKLWDNFETGYSVQFAAQRPAVQDDAVQKFDRSGSGNIIGRHEGYDETAIVVDLPLDMGPVGSRRQAFKMAKHKLRPVGDEDFVGTITLTSGLIAGDHTPGDPLTTGDITPNRAVRPGWNVKVPHFPVIDDSTLFHVVACRVLDKGWTVELVVDTRARDAMEAWAVHQRNRANRYQPSRYLGGVRRRSIGVQDTVTPWDKIVGQTDRDWSLAAGEWTEIPVPAGQAGTVQRSEIVLEDAREFAAMVSERPIPLGRLNRKVLPLANFGTGTPWWGVPATRAWLKKYGAKVSWGTYENPCGYDPYMKNHPQTGLATAAPLTGEFVDDDSWGYDCGLDGAVLYLYIWVGVANTLPRQRVFRQQLDGSGT